MYIHIYICETIKLKTQLSSKSYMLFACRHHWLDGLRSDNCILSVSGWA